MPAITAAQQSAIDAIVNSHQSPTARIQALIAYAKTFSSHATGTKGTVLYSGPQTAGNSKFDNIGLQKFASQNGLDMLDNTEFGQSTIHLPRIPNGSSSRCPTCLARLTAHSENKDEAEQLVHRSAVGLCAM